MSGAKPRKIKLTPEHRRKFEGYIQKWQSLLNLGDWRIGLSPTFASVKHLACVAHFDLEARVATIRLAEHWNEANPPTDKNLEDTACHEVCHILLYEMLQFHEDPTAKPEDRASAEHRVIITLVRLFVGNV